MSDADQQDGAAETRRKRPGRRRTATPGGGGLRAAMGTHRTAPRAEVVEEVVEGDVIVAEIVPAGHPDLAPIPAQVSADPNPAAPMLPDTVTLSFNPAAAPIERGPRRAFFEMVVRTAEVRFATTTRQAQLQRILDVGMALEYLNTEELYYDEEHPGRTFAEYVEATFDLKRSTAYQVMDTVPVRAALTAGGHTDVLPSLEQVKVLAPVIRAHGAAKAVEAYDLATELRGKATGAALRQAVKDLNLAPAADEVKEESAPTGPQITALTLLGKAANSARHARSLLSRKVLEAAIAENPEAAQRHIADLAAQVNSIGKLLP